MISERTQRMIDSAPDYYQQSQVYEAIQSAIGEELDLVAINNEDVRKQLRILTATWGLVYWEERLGIKTIPTDSYEIRRSRVLSSWRGSGNFSASLIESVAASFSGGEVDVRIDIPEQRVYIKFVGARGIPENIQDLFNQIDNIIHAHLGVTYEYTYLTQAELDEVNLTWDQLDAYNFTWDEFEIWKP